MEGSAPIKESIRRRHTLNKRRKTELIAITAFMTAVLILCGFSFGEVRLKTNTPLIDLQETVKESSFGDDKTMTDTDTAEEDEPEEEILEEETEIVYTIRVREQSLYFNGFRQTGIPDMVSKIKGAGDDLTVILQDDYADHRNYTAVRTALLEAHIPFTEETLR